MLSGSIQTRNGLPLAARAPQWNPYPCKHQKHFEIRWLEGVILRLSNFDHFQFGAVQRTAMLDETLHNSPLALRHRDNGLEEIAHA